jgi:hypothetical protein
VERGFFVGFFKVFSSRAGHVNGLDFTCREFAPRVFLATSVYVSILTLQSIAIDVMLTDACINSVAGLTAASADGLTDGARWCLSITWRIAGLLTRPITRLIVSWASVIAWGCSMTITAGLELRGGQIIALTGTVLALMLLVTRLLLISLHVAGRVTAILRLRIGLAFSEGCGQETSVIQALHDQAQSILYRCWFVGKHVLTEEIEIAPGHEDFGQLFGRGKIRDSSLSDCKLETPMPVCPSGGRQRIAVENERVTSPQHSRG